MCACSFSCFPNSTLLIHNDLFLSPWLSVSSLQNEASAGLTQVLISTAQWLAKDLGFKEMGYPKTEKALYEPLVVRS